MLKRTRSLVPIGGWCPLQTYHDAEGITTAWALTTRPGHDRAGRQRDLRVVWLRLGGTGPERDHR